MTDFGRRVLIHAPAHQDGGGDEISVAALSGELTDNQPPKPHLLGSPTHTADSLVNLNLAISDATLDDSSAARTPSAHKDTHQNGETDEISVDGLSGELADAQPVKAHDLTGGSHNAGTLANLNTLISDATLDKDSDTRTPATHAASHQDGGTDEIVATGLVGRINFVDRGDPQNEDFVVGNFTTDDTWRDLSLASVVTAGAIAVSIRLQLVASSADRKFQLRKKGNTYTQAASGLRTQVDSIYVDADVIVPCDANRVIQYRGDDITFDGINLIIKGWFI